MDKIDLDEIIEDQFAKENNYEYHRRVVKNMMKDAIKQALTLAAENARTETYFFNDWSETGGTGYQVSKQSILDIEKLIT